MNVRDKKRRHRLSMLLIIMVASFSPASLTRALDEYLTVQEFHRLHPEQRQVSTRFATLVQAKGQPMVITQTRPIKIACIYPGEQLSDYWRRSILSFKKRLDEIGVQYELFEYFSKPAVEYRTQEKQIRLALEQEPDYLVFTLDARKHKRIIERILMRKRPKIILQNITTPLRIWEGKHPFLYVGFDHVTGTQLLAKYFIENTSGESDYALLYFSQGYVSAMRGDSFIQFMASDPRFTLKASYYTDGQREKAKQATLEILQEYPQVKFLYACSTDVALGAIEALQQTEKIGDIRINGWGGGSSELNAIQEGKMDVTVMRMNDDNGVAMAEAIRLDLEGKTHDVPTVFSGEMVLIEQGISESAIRDLKARAFRYSGTE